MKRFRGKKVRKVEQHQPTRRGRLRDLATFTTPQQGQCHSHSDDDETTGSGFVPGKEGTLGGGNISRAHQGQLEHWKRSRVDHVQLRSHQQWKATSGCFPVELFHGSVWQ